MLDDVVDGRARGDGWMCLWMCINAWMPFSNHENDVHWDRRDEEKRNGGIGIKYNIHIVFLSRVWRDNLCMVESIFAAVQ